MNGHEKDVIEMKKAKELPNVLWESCSAFCNTSGGWILMGFSAKKQIIRKKRKLRELP